MVRRCFSLDRNEIKDKIFPLPSTWMVEWRIYG
jgi:hypothetical protein